jgi:hypothetical protein
MPLYWITGPGVTHRVLSCGNWVRRHREMKKQIKEGERGFISDSKSTKR